MSMRFCINCQKETNFKHGVCPQCFSTHDTCCTCGGPMNDYDLRMNEWRHCPKGCAEDNISQELDNDPNWNEPMPADQYDPSFHESGTQLSKRYRNRCWQCRKEIDSNVCHPDKVKEFAFICSEPSCDVSLREHPNVRLYVARYRGVPSENITDEILNELLSRPKR